jgi:PD-(D/E)XK nuclease superfamily protein
MLTELTTNQKGCLTEAAIAYAAAKAGISVLKPLADERYDLVFDVGARFIRVQCKTATLRGDVIVVPCRSARRGPDGMIRRYYTSDEIDAFAAYCCELGRAFYLPLDIFDAPTAIQLRLNPARNNQRTGINWADDFDFSRLQFGRPGAIAQLGERVAGSDEVAGSSPAGSIG